MQRSQRKLMIVAGSASAMLFGMAALAFEPPNRPPAGNPPPTPPREPGNPPRQAQPPARGPASGYIAAPPGSETLTGTVNANCVQIYENDDFKGTESTLNAVTTGFNAGAINEMPKGLNDAVTSVRWNLDPGVIVVLYEDAQGKGEQMILWGKGQMPTLSKNDFNDKASRWAWYDLGGGNAEGRSAGAMALPHGCDPLGTQVPQDTLQMFLDKNFKGDMQQVSPLTGQKAGELHPLPNGLPDALTSMRWNLPEGVIVMFYQDANGKKQQVAVWGQAQLADLDAWDFNDKASRWSWAYIGSPTRSRVTPP